MPPDRDRIALLFPHARPEWLTALCELAPLLARHYNFNRLDWVHFCGQIGAETDGLRIAGMTESMYYTSSERILSVFRYRLGVALERDAGLRAKYRTRERLAEALVRNPTFLADIVYGGREGTPWMQGSRYIGRGPTQITHLNNYAAVRDEMRAQDATLGVEPLGMSDDVPDLVRHPEALADNPRLGVRSAFADWHIKGLSRWARVNDVDAVSARLNTGDATRVSLVNNLAGRRRWVARAAELWPDRPESLESSQGSTIAGGSMAGGGAMPGDPVVRPGAAGDAVVALQEALTAKGFPLGSVDGHFGVITRRAVAAFQAEYHLSPDGVIDQDDWDELRRPPSTSFGSRETAATVPGSQQIAAAKGIKRVINTVTAGGVAETTGQAWFGVSPSASLLQFLDQIASYVSKFSAIGVTLKPAHVMLLGLLIAAPFVWRWWRWADGVETARLTAHRNATNVNR